MTAYLVRRVGQILVTLFLFITLAFFLIQAQPGSYASFYAFNPDIPPEVKAKIEAAFGLDKPLWQQYLIHLKNYGSGNFGVSFRHYPQSVVDVILERLPRTVMPVMCIANYFSHALFIDRLTPPCSGAVRRTLLVAWGQRINRWSFPELLAM
jgi:peptide/nickel transport system permease protein